MRIPRILIPTTLALASTIALPAVVVVSTSTMAGTAIVAAGTVSGGTADCPKYAKCGMSLNHCEPTLLAG
jgi:hypothetical protein